MKMKLIEKLEAPRRKYVKEEFALIIMFLLIITLFFSRPEVIGYASTNVHNQNLDLLIEQSQMYHLRSVYPTPVHLTSMQLSGEIIGDGTVSVYLDNEKGSRVLVFNNQKREGSQINRITGTVAAGEGSAGGVSGLSVTADSMPMKHQEPALKLTEGKLVFEYEKVGGGSQTFNGRFSNDCIESCLLQSDQFNQESFQLIFLIEPGTKLRVTGLSYTTLDEV